MSANRGGGALLFSESFLLVSYQVEEVIAGRLIIIRAEFEKFKMVFINVYAMCRPICVFQGRYRYRLLQIK